MIITAITRYGDKGNRYRVDVDGEYWYILADTLIMDFHLRKGKEVTEELLTEIKEAAEYRKGRERAFYLLESRDHSKSELAAKLARHCDWEMARRIADEMESLGLIKEDVYAKRLAEYLSTSRKQGPRRIRQEMMKRGIPRDLIEEALADLETDEDALIELVRRKYGRYLMPTEEEEEPSAFSRGFSKGKNKALQALLRLGHSYGESLAAIEAVEEELAEEAE